jgi:hypothetical protein
MEMAHARQAETLQVSGRVRNQSETPADRITAVIAVFDKKGRAVASASAPIERQSLAPGDESPFTVAVPHVAEVGRYRVSFLNDAGLIRHIDRRTEATEQPATIAKK